MDNLIHLSPSHKETETEKERETERERERERETHVVFAPGNEICFADLVLLGGGFLPYLAVRFLLSCFVWLRVRLHVRLCVRLCVRLGVRLRAVACAKKARGQ